MQNALTTAREYLAAHGPTTLWELARHLQARHPDEDPGAHYDTLDSWLHDGWIDVRLDETRRGSVEIVLAVHARPVKLGGTHTRLGVDGKHVDLDWLAHVWLRAAEGRYLQPGGRIRLRATVADVIDGRVPPVWAGDRAVLAAWRAATPCVCHPDGLQYRDAVEAQAA